MSKTYTATIGIEIHVQLATKSKMFCACNNDSKDAKPNTNVCPVCLALPGTLPVVNKRAVELAIRLGHGFHANIAEHTSFDRKNYFYPDSPKGYQITQMDEPIIQKGYVEILVDNEYKKIGVHHAHLEEDAGKLTHPVGTDYSLVDFNRAGTPLIEIVSDPDMHTPVEAKRYLQEVYAIATTLGVTHGDLQHGNFKFDLNVSVSSNDELGTRTEIKNLNSFRNAERALSYEIQRQIDVLDRGEQVVQETRGWNDGKGQTFSQRSKEEANDYRYFPEPDIPPLVLKQDFVESVLKEVGDITMPIDIRKQLQNLGLSVSEQDILIDQPNTCKVFLEAQEYTNNDKQKKTIINILVGDYQAWLAQNSSTVAKWKGKDLAKLVRLIDEGTISSKIAKDLLPEIIQGNDPTQLIEQKGLAQISDDNELEKIVQEVIDKNPQAVTDYQSGNEKAVAFFVGQIMQATRGQANPGKTNQLVLKLLKK